MREADALIQLVDVLVIHLLRASLRTEPATTGEPIEVIARQPAPPLKPPSPAPAPTPPGRYRAHLWQRADRDISKNPQNRLIWCGHLQGQHNCQ